MNTPFSTKSIYLGRLPTSLQGQFLIETPDEQGRIHRQVVSDEHELRRVTRPDSTVWAARFGGWVKQEVKTAKGAGKDRQSRGEA